MKYHEKLLPLKVSFIDLFIEVTISIMLVHALCELLNSFSVSNIVVCGMTASDKLYFRSPKFESFI